MHVTHAPAEQQALPVDFQRMFTFNAGTAFLDGEHVGEVGSDFHLDDSRYGHTTRIADLDVLLPHRPEAAPANDQQAWL